MYSKDREDQAKALDPMQARLRRQFDEMEARGEVYTMRKPPNPDRAAALKFLADEGQKCDRLLEE